MHGNQSIKEFYKDQNVFITGATGFVGMALLEKLLRSFPGITKIYVLIRNKHAETSEVRIENFFDNELFSTIKTSNRNYASKVVWVEGDLILPNLGIEANTLEELKNTINIIIHNGASINLNDTLRASININIRGTYCLLKIANECRNFKSFTHVSTIFVNCRKRENYIEERLYPHEDEPMELLKMAEESNDEMMELKTLEILKEWPNTYTYTKNATENLVYEFRNKFPIAIYRPGGVMYSYNEPVPYWGMSYSGLPKIIQYWRKGYNVRVSSNVNSMTVPVDMVVNGLIAVVWDSRNRHAKFYNYSSVETNILRCAEYQAQFVKTRKYLIDFESKEYERYCEKIDAILISAGKKARYRKQRESLKSFIEHLCIYMHKTYECQGDNINQLWGVMSAEDRHLLFFDLCHINWKKYLEGLHKAMPHIYDDEVLPQVTISKL